MGTAARITIALPPYGSLMRSLVVDSLAQLAYIAVSDPEMAGRVNVLSEGEKIIVEGENKDAVEALFNSMLKSAFYVISQKIENKAGGVPAHKNDKKTLSLLCGCSGLEKCYSNFVDAVSKTLRRGKFTFEQLRDLSSIRIESSKSTLKITYGKGGLALPQILLVERTQASVEFPRGRGGKPIDVRSSEPWLLLALAGFAVSFATYRDSVAVLVHVPLSLLLEAISDKDMLYALETENGIIPTMTALRVPAYPKSAYHLYSSVEVLRNIKSNSRLLDIITSRPVPLEIDRIAFRGNNYVQVERFDVEHSSLLSKLAFLDEESLDWLRRMSRSVLYNLGKPASLQSYLSLTEKVYSALTGAGDILDALYYANRVVLELETSNKKEPVAQSIRRQFAHATRQLMKLREGHG